MSIVNAAIVPHAPILVPKIGKENTKRLEQTIRSFDKLSQKFIENQVDTIIIISPHGPTQSNTFTMNLNPNFYCDFEEFGDLVTKCSWKGNVGMTHKIREYLETRAPLQLISTEKLDYGSSIPLLLLTSNLPNVKIIPIYYSGLDNQAHYKLGTLLKREMLIFTEQIAIIASGDLSHRLTKDAPAGFSPKGKKFDQKLINLLSKNKSQEIIDLNTDLSKDAGECGLKSILILLGILDGIKHKPQILSYEAPFGVGYLVMNFDL